MSEQLEIWKAAATSFRELCVCPTLPVECQLLSLGCFVDGLMMGDRSWQFQKYVNWINIAFLHSAFHRLLLRWIYKIFFCAEECYFLNTEILCRNICVACCLPAWSKIGAGSCSAASEQHSYLCIFRQKTVKFGESFCSSASAMAALSSSWKALQKPIR